MELKKKIKNRISDFLKEIKGYDCFSKIEPKMKEAQEAVGYTFENISFLMLAFCRTKISGKNNATYQNDTLAQIGDTVLDLILCEYGFSEGIGKYKIDELRKDKAGNKKLAQITSDRFEAFCYHRSYFYKDAPKEKQVSCGAHDSIVEAIIGAIYLDGGLNEARKWIYTNFLEEQK